MRTPWATTNPPRIAAIQTQISVGLKAPTDVRVTAAAPARGSKSMKDTELRSSITAVELGAAVVVEDPASEVGAAVIVEVSVAVVEDEPAEVVETAVVVETVRSLLMEAVWAPVHVVEGRRPRPCPPRPLPVRFLLLPLRLPRPFLWISNRLVGKAFWMSVPAAVG